MLLSVTKLLCTDSRVGAAGNRYHGTASLTVICGALIVAQRSTRHKNIVGLLETSTISIPNSSEKEVYILMEFCSGTLHSPQHQANLQAVPRRS